MQLVKEENTTFLIGPIVTPELEDFINFMINFYQSVFIGIDDWLAKQERRFFIACVIIGNKGLDYTSESARKILREVFNLRRQSDVRGYLRRLEEKNWLASNKKTKKIELNEFFKFDLHNHVLDLNVKLNYSNGKVR